MELLTILAILAEAARLTNTIAERLAKGEITPEEALAQWQETTARWTDAAFAWRNTEAPVGHFPPAGYTSPPTT